MTPALRRPILATAAIVLAAVAAWLVWRGDVAPAAMLLATLAAAAAAVVATPRSSANRPPSVPDGEAPAAAVIYPDPVILVDPRCVVVEFNAEAAAMVPALRAGQPLAFALRDPGVLDAIPAVMATGEPVTVATGGRIAGEPTHEIRLRRLAADPAPGRAAVGLFVRDLTATRRLEAMRVDFIANVSHELRTPLASLAGFIDTLQGPARDDPAAREKFLGIMAAQAGRMTRLIDDLLQLSRVELREHLPPESSVDLAASVAHMVELLLPLARERGVAIALDLPGGAVPVRGDRDEVLRLVENLVENAIKYGGQSGSVDVAVCPAGGRVDLVVADHGPGIAPEHLPRLTERFYRVDPGESRAQGGTGLGLAIVKHIAGRHRARLTIESVPGRGATFRVSFPAQAAPAPEPSPLPMALPNR